MKTNWPDHFSARTMGRSLGSSGLSSFAIALEAWRRGLEVTFTAKDLHLYTVTDGRRSIEFNFSRPDSITTRRDYLRLNRKGETTARLLEAEIPAPVGTLLRQDVNNSELISIAETIGYPLVLKPNTGSMGQGVITGISNEDELQTSFHHLVNDLKTREIVIERHHEGDDYRILVVGDRVAGAVKRIPANVTADGSSTISKLISEKNLSRKWNPFLTAGLIKVDYEINKCLQLQGLSLEDIPEKGRYIELRRVANASAGGDVVDVTDQIPETVKAAAIRAVKLFPGVVIAGVDMLYRADDATNANNYVIIEINSRPQIGVNMYPSIGTGRDVPKIIIDTLFPGTERPKSRGIEKLRFDESAVKIAFRSGVISKFTLPVIATHNYPYRVKFSFRNESGELAMKPYSVRTLQRIALKYGVSGELKRHSQGGLELRVAAENEMDVHPLIAAVQKASELSESSSEPWQGPVTIGFNVVL